MFSRHHKEARLFPLRAIRLGGGGIVHIPTLVTHSHEFSLYVYSSIMLRPTGLMYEIHSVDYQPRLNEHGVT